MNVPSISLFIYIRTKRDETLLWLPWAKFIHCHGSLGPSLSCWFEIKSWDCLNIAFIGLPPASQYYKAWDRKSLEQRRTKPQARSIKHRSKWKSSNDWSDSGQRHEGCGYADCSHSIDLNWWWTTWTLDVLSFDVGGAYSPSTEFRSTRWGDRKMLLLWLYAADFKAVNIWGLQISIERIISLVMRWKMSCSRI